MKALSGVFVWFLLMCLSDDTTTAAHQTFDIRRDALPRECTLMATPGNCQEATSCSRRSGFHEIKLPQWSNESFLVECDIHTSGGAWTVIQRRQDGSMDFNRPWADYKAGFGEVDGEFFIGLDRLHALTSYDGPQELLVLMDMEVNGTAIRSYYARYDSFAVGGEDQKYKLKRIGRYSGNAGDSLQYHINCKFSTKDEDNDQAAMNCAESYMGGWWHKKCHRSNLNGHYNDKSYGKGINWHTLTGDTISLKFVQMMIRRKQYQENDVM